LDASELHDNHATLSTLVGVLVAPLVRARWSKREIELRLFIPLSLLFFALPNLFDDERREHRLYPPLDWREGSDWVFPGVGSLLHGS